jgi:hypothetical protein
MAAEGIMTDRASNNYSDEGCMVKSIGRKARGSLLAVDSSSIIFPPAINHELSSICSS